MSLKGFAWFLAHRLFLQLLRICLPSWQSSSLQLEHSLQIRTSHRRNHGDNMSQEIQFNICPRCKDADPKSNVSRKKDSDVRHIHPFKVKNIGNWLSQFLQNGAIIMMDSSIDTRRSPEVDFNGEYMYFECLTFNWLRNNRLDYTRWPQWFVDTTHMRTTSEKFVTFASIARLATVICNVQYLRRQRRYLLLDESLRCSEIVAFEIQDCSCRLHKCQCTNYVLQCFTRNNLR